MRFGLCVVAEIKKTITSYAKRPFVLGYRISPEEPGDRGYRTDDSLAFIDRLISAGIDYVHVSLASVLESRPIDAPEGPTIAEIFARRVAHRVPVIAAGGIRTFAQAEASLELGLSAVALGQGLVMNPNWVELAKAGRADEIQTELDPEMFETLAIPPKLEAIIEAAKGWFPIKLAQVAE